MKLLNLLSLLVVIGVFSFSHTVYAECDDKYKVTARALNIRSIPNVTGKKVGKYLKGHIICVSEISDGWAKTEKGWVSGKYIIIHKVIIHKDLDSKPPFGLRWGMSVQDVKSMGIDLTKEEENSYKSKDNRFTFDFLENYPDSVKQDEYLLIIFNEKNALITVFYSSPTYMGNQIEDIKNNFADLLFRNSTGYEPKNKGDSIFRQIYDNKDDGSFIIHSVSKVKHNSYSTSLLWRCPIKYVE